MYFIFSIFGEIGGVAGYVQSSLPRRVNSTRNVLFFLNKKVYIISFMYS